MELLKKSVLLNDLYNSKRMYSFHTSSYFAKREVMDKTSILFKQMLDRNIVLSSILLGDIYYIDNIMSIYRWHSKGSWTSTIKDMSSREYNEKLFKYIDYDVLFDKCSNMEYHKYIMKRIYKFAIETCKTHPKETNNIFKENNGNYFEMYEVVGLINELKYLVSVYLPNTSTKIRKIKINNIRRKL